MLQVKKTTILFSKMRTVLFRIELFCGEEDAWPGKETSAVYVLFPIDVDTRFLRKHKKHLELNSPKILELQIVF